MADLKLADAHGGERIVPNAEVERFTGKFNGEVLRPTDQIQQEKERAFARSLFVQHNNDPNLTAPSHSPKSPPDSAGSLSASSHTQPHPELLPDLIFQLLLGLPVWRHIFPAIQSRADPSR